MNLLTILHIINISVIILLIGHLAIRVKSMKYGVYWSIVRVIRFKDRRGVNWLWENKIYLLYMAIIVIMFLINITLIGQLLNNSVFNRPIFILLLSPLAWSAVLIYFNMTKKKIS